MTNKINATAQAQQDAARKGDGTFGNQLHSPGSTVLPGRSGEISILEDFAADQADTIEGRDRANQARLAIAARNIHAFMPEAGSFTMSADGDRCTVDHAWDENNWRMHEDDRESIARELRDAGVIPADQLVRLEDKRRWMPDAISPTSPKITSKGRTVYLTLPDGVVVDRTSKSNHYTHAVVASPEDPERVKAEAERAMAESQSVIDDIDGALSAEKLVIRSSRRFRDGRDPDVDSQGKPAYNGFEYKIYSADGKRELDRIWGNSKQEVEGSYDENGKYDGKRTSKVFPAAAAKLAEKRRLYQDSVDKHAGTMAAVEAGTYDVGGWAVYGFSGSEANAGKTARSNQGYTPTRKFTTMPVDR